MLKPLLVWGATGQLKVVNEFCNDIGYQIIAIVDSAKFDCSPIDGIPLLHGSEAFETWLTQVDHNEELSYVVAIGGDKGSDRREIASYLSIKGLKPVSVVHPSSYVAKDAKIGKGCQIMAMATLAAEVRLGDQVLVNTSASIDHESILNDGVHVGPGATLCGCVEVGENTFIGAGAIVLPRVNIGSNTIIGAGTVVTRSVPDNVIAFGNPAKIIRDKGWNKA